MESNDQQLQDTDYNPFVRSFMAYQALYYHDGQEIENLTLRVSLDIFRKRPINK